MTLISLACNKRVRDSIIMLVVAKTCGYRGHPNIAFHGKDHNNHHSNLSSHIWLILISLSWRERESVCINMLVLTKIEGHRGPTTLSSGLEIHRGYHND